MSALRTLVILSLIGMTMPSLATENPSAGGTGAAVPFLELTPWQIMGYRSGTDMRSVEPRTIPPQLAFSAGQVTGNVGCNSFSGAYRLEGDRLTIDPRMATTMMACEESVMALEQAVTTQLAAVSGYRYAGSRLELLNAEGVTLLLLDALRETPLVGVTWRLDRYNNGKQALVSTAAGTDITMLLTPDGRLSGSDGCNRYMSNYTLQEGYLTIRQGATTRMACRNPSIAEQARAYAQTLSQVRRYRITGEQLLLTSDDGATLASFRAVRSPVRSAVNP